MTFECGRRFEVKVRAMEDHWGQIGVNEDERRVKVSHSRKV